MTSAFFFNLQKVLRVHASWVSFMEMTKLSCVKTELDLKPINSLKHALMAGYSRQEARQMRVCRYLGCGAVKSSRLGAVS